MLYWKVGTRINSDILKDERAAYGKEVVVSLAGQLTERYGRGWDEKNLRHCLRTAETFTEDDIVYAVRRQLGWTHLRTIMYMKNDLQRQFYMEMCIQEKWSTRLLNEKISGILLGLVQK